MSQSQAFGHFAEFGGINNYDDPTTLQKNQFISATNVDISDRGSVLRRDGYTHVLTAANSHSLWCMDNRIALYVCGTELRLLGPNYTHTVIRSDMDPLRPVAYELVNNEVYYTNGVVIGYISGGVGYSLPTPSDPLKTTMPPGHLIEYYNGRLYIARGGYVFYSDPMNLTATRRRMNFVQFPGYITMLHCVQDGIFVSAGDATYFLRGADPSKFELMDTDSAPAYMGTDRDITDTLVDSNAGVSGNAVIWTSSNGICVGSDGGKFVNLTLGKYIVPTAAYGAAIFRQTPDKINQYLVVLHT